MNTLNHQVDNTDAFAKPSHIKEIKKRLYITLVVFAVASMYTLIDPAIGNFALAVAGMSLGLHGLHTYPKTVYVFNDKKYYTMFLALAAFSIFIASYELLDTQQNRFIFIDTTTTGVFLAFAVLTQGARYLLSDVAVTKFVIFLLLLAFVVQIFNSVLLATIGLTLLYVIVLKSINSR